MSLLKFQIKVSSQSLSLSLYRPSPFPSILSFRIQLACEDRVKAIIVSFSCSNDITRLVLTTMNPTLDIYHLSHYEFAFHMNMINNLILFH
jgi:hypothetical protein